MSHFIFLLSSLLKNKKQLLDLDQNFIVTVYRTSSLLINICQSRIILSYAQSTQPQDVHLLFLNIWGLKNLAKHKKAVMQHPHCSHFSSCCQGLHPSSFLWPQHGFPTNQTRGADTALLDVGINIQRQWDFIITDVLFAVCTDVCTDAELNSRSVIMSRRSKYTIKKKQASMIICWFCWLLGKGKRFCRWEGIQRCKIFCLFMLHYIFRVSHYGCLTLLSAISYFRT